MQTMYFSDYGELEWIETAQYLAEPWKYLRSVEGTDGKMYDIVIQEDYPCELRYTTIC